MMRKCRDILLLLVLIAIDGFAASPLATPSVEQCGEGDWCEAPIHAPILPGDTVPLHTIKDDFQLEEPPVQEVGGKEEYNEEEMSGYNGNDDDDDEEDYDSNEAYYDGDEYYYEEEYYYEDEYYEDYDEEWGDEEWDDEEWDEEPFSPWEYEEELQTLGFIQHALQCYSIMYVEQRPIPGADTWEALRRAYREAVGEPSNTTLPHRSSTPFRAPVHVGYNADGMGRGLFAAKDIPKGTIIYDHEVHDARFYTAAAFRKFLSLLDRELACEATNWAWSSRDDENAPYYIAINLDEGSLMNTANKREENNVDGDNAALRDIAAGEELFQFYGDFVDLKGWDALGL